MKKVMIAAALAAFVATPALAAKAKKTPPAPPPTSAYSWAGCYVGVNGGYGWNNGSTHYEDPHTTPDLINFIGGANTFIPTPSGTGGASGLGGGGAGCNWQTPQQWVLGFEADIDGGRIAGSKTNSANSVAGAPFATGPVVAAFGTGTASEHSQLNWLSTIRSRIGLAIQDRLLLFATGGLAIGGLSADGSVTFANAVGQMTWSGARSETKIGSVIGGGAEWAFADRWTAKAEYLWYDLGNASHTLNCTSSTNPFISCANPNIFSTLGIAQASFHGSIIRFGINYRFN